MIKTELKIDGMMCAMCEAHVNDAVRNAFGVSKVTSSHKKGTCEIISNRQLDEERIKQVLAATGYIVTDVSSSPYEKKGFSLFKK